MFQKLSKFLLDLFFPKKCLGCNKTGIYICQSCLEKIEIAKNNKCPFCDRPTPEGRICNLCQKKSRLNYLIWAAPYSNPLVKKLIRIFKYHYIRELAEPLAQLLIKRLTPGVKHDTIIIPIPLHKRRFGERGFNQAELLAKEIANHFSIPLESKALKRKKYTPSQAKTKNHKERRKSLKNAFEINPEFAKKCTTENKNLLKDKTIILIDDVTTTGATLSEAAKVLKRAGVKKVWGLIIARG